jgi:hypothetical protein
VSVFFNCFAFKIKTNVVSSFIEARGEGGKKGLKNGLCQTKAIKTTKSFIENHLG